MKLSALPLAALLTVGCHSDEQPPPPAPRVLGVAFEEDRDLVTITLAISNPTDQTIRLDECRADTLWSFLITSEAAQAPEGLDVDFTIGPFELPSGDQGLLPLAGKWHQMDAGRPMVAILHVRFLLSGPSGETMRVGPATVLFRVGDGQFDLGEVPALRDTLESLPGAKSEGVEALIDQLGPE